MDLIEEWKKLNEKIEQWIRLPHCFLWSKLYKYSAWNHINAPNGIYLYRVTTIVLIILYPKITIQIDKNSLRNTRTRVYKIIRIPLPKGFLLDNRDGFLCCLIFKKMTQVLIIFIFRKLCNEMNSILHCYFMHMRGISKKRNLHGQSKRRKGQCHHKCLKKTSEKRYCEEQSVSSNDVVILT